MKLQDVDNYRCFICKKYKDKAIKDINVLKQKYKDLFEKFAGEKDLLFYVEDDDL